MIQAATPALFIGHGSPMNAIEANRFTRAWAERFAALPRPQAILCVSAHWETQGVQVTAMERPRTIHDFRGFPAELFAIDDPAPGSPALAERLQRLVPEITLDHAWGLDHGAWSVLRPMRQEGVLVLGSGNLVHNLGQMVLEDLLDPLALGPEAAHALPSLEHYLPLLYVLGVRDPGESLAFFNAEVTLGAISMRSFQVGAGGG